MRLEEMLDERDYLEWYMVANPYAKNHVFIIRHDELDYEIEQELRR